MHWLPAGIALMALSGALHASLTHEVIHGHPFRNQRLNDALVWLPLSIFVPFERFRDTHMAHHQNAVLTDPYDDPESNYLCPDVWETLPRWVQHLLNVNNTLAGRILIGPVVGYAAFLWNERRAAQAGDARVVAGWRAHIFPVALVLAWGLFVSAMPIWAFVLGAYLSHAILKIRTFLEHQAHEHTANRSVIIEDRGVLSFLFLNNNLHVVHHMHPRVPWYRLPTLYGSNRERYVSRNGGYLYRSYGDVFRRYLWAQKDPVAHPHAGRRS